MKKLMRVFLITGFLTVFLVACNTQEPEVSEEDSGTVEPSGDYFTYQDDYIRFKHPEGWLVSGSRSGDQNLVTIEKGSGYDFVLEAERVTGLNTKEDFDARIDQEFSQGLEAAENEDYITQLSFEDITIDGHEGKSLLLEVEILQGTGEMLYQELSEELNHYEQIEDFLSPYENSKAFIEEITEDEALQQELLDLVMELEGERTEPEQSLSIARARLEHLKVLLSEDTAGEQRQKVSIIAKDDLVFRVYFFHNPSGYQDMIDQVFDLMDTIEFVE